MPDLREVEYVRQWLDDLIRRASNAIDMLSAARVRRYIDQLLGRPTPAASPTPTPRPTIAPALRKGTWDEHINRLNRPGP